MADGVIRYGQREDLELLGRYDTHISEEELRNAVVQKRVLVLSVGQRCVRWLGDPRVGDQIRVRGRG